ncbi:MAG: flagellar biosynthesis anti-sigma factor FlgM [Proteobacteria bacterium]|nr:flagellar biosynthesis anti-sigma factor FlgM [Pseudomonadota bacterium]
MPPIEFPGGVTPPQRVTGSIAPRNEGAVRAGANGHASITPQSTVVRGAALDPGEAPIDADRVTAIRRAIEQGTYPVIPTRVADAMIAAGLLLRERK